MVRMKVLVSVRLCHEVRRARRRHQCVYLY